MSVESLIVGAVVVVLNTGTRKLLKPNIGLMSKYVMIDWQCLPWLRIEAVGEKVSMGQCRSLCGLQGGVCLQNICYP